MDKTKFGLSIYPEKAEYDELIEYLTRASKYGFRRVFANLIGLSRQDLEKFKKVCLFASGNLNIEMIADIDETVLEIFQIKLTDTNFFKEIGIKIIRLDVKFDAKDVADLSLNKDGIQLEINASDFSELEKEIIKFDHNKENIIGSHNFFPQKYTGLSLEKYLKANNSMRQSGFKISAFVSINNRKTIDAWDESEGAVTLEKTRNMKLFDQFQYLLEADKIDYIIVSNMFITNEEFEEISKIENNKIIFNGSFSKDRKISDEEKEIFLYDKHKLRGDNPDTIMFRSTISRKIFKAHDIKPNKNIKEYFEPGDVIILNNKYGRYKSELHIIRKKIPVSNMKNFVGKINNDQIGLLSFPKPNMIFQIKLGKESDDF